MILKSLELQGFKTFPDKTVLSFEQGVTSVVGPNGSGKSNISDAIRWALGEQSVRALRCSKMEDVIFSGTPQRKAQGFAEVTLSIDNTDRRLPFDSDTVAVTRRYYRSGESEYLINKTQVRLKDINELFMDTGLGRDGYSIIGQGRIDAIVAAKSEDRREIFEEAAGISRYRYRKEEAERRLSRAEESLVRLRDIIAELEGRVEPLRIQAEKAEQFIAYEGERKGLEIGIWLQTLAGSGKLLREQEEKLGAAAAQQSELSAQAEELSQAMEENIRRSNACSAQMDAARGEAASLEEQAIRAEGEIGVLENEISHGERDKVRLEEQKSLLAQSGEALAAELAQKEAQAEEKAVQIRESRERLLTYTQRLEELRRGADETTRQMEQAAQDMAARRDSMAQARIALSSAESSLGEIGLRRQALAQSAGERAGQKASLEEEREGLAELLEHGAAAITGEENSIRGHEMLLEGRSKRVESARAQAEKLHLDAQEQLRRAALLEDLERSMEGFNQSVKAVLKEAQRGMLGGICGPVSRIITVPQDYVVAIETALGPAMQHIVTEKESDAKRAIRFLQQREQGRATFLPVDTIHGSLLDLRGIEDAPGFVGLGAELCSCEEQYQGILDQLLGRVVVAEDLDSAAAIAKKGGYRFRVVSLDGQVVNAGGSLTGGSRGRSSGLLSRAGEIAKAREQAEKLQKKEEEAQGQLRQRQQELAALQGELSAARGELAALQEEQIRLQGELSRVLRELELLAGQEAAAAAEEKQLVLRSAALEEQAAGAGKTIASLEKEERQADAALAGLSGSREAQMSRVEEISGVIQEIHMAEYSANSDRESLLAAAQELRSRMEDSAGSIAALEEELAALKRRREDWLGQIAARRERAEQLRSQAGEKKAAVEEGARQRQALEQEAASFREQERQLAGQRENLAREIARLQERGESLQKEVDSIEQRLWEDYELTRREAEEAAAPVEDLNAAQRRLNQLRNLIRELGAVNLGAVVEYQEVSQRYHFMKEQSQDAEQAKAELLKLIEGLTKQMRERFVEKFAEINRQFSGIFRELFGGGAAELSFTDTEDVLRSGIEIKVHPPGKIVTHIESLSGGEKTLVAISIYFAIMRVNPPPFCVLDEIDAALDDVNVGRYAQYLRRMSGNSQFITITHRRGTMEGSDMLYGVTMQDEGVSKLLALHTDQAAAFDAQ